MIKTLCKHVSVIIDNQLRTDEKVLIFTIYVKRQLLFKIINIFELEKRM